MSLYEVQVSEILITQNLLLVMLPKVYLKNEIKPYQVPVTSVNLSIPNTADKAHPTWIQLYTKYNEEPKYC